MGGWRVSGGPGIGMSLSHLSLCIPAPVRENRICSKEISCGAEVSSEDELPGSEGAPDQKGNLPSEVSEELEVGQRVTGESLTYRL